MYVLSEHVTVEMHKFQIKELGIPEKQNSRNTKIRFVILAQREETNQGPNDEKWSKTAVSIYSFHSGKSKKEVECH